MKLTDSLLDYIADYTEKFCRQLSMEPPYLWFTTREVKDAPIEWTQGRRTSAYKYYGVAYPNADAVFLNIRVMKGRKIVKGVIAHELVHVRFPYLSHGEEFERKIKQILQGRKFPPYKGKEQRRKIICH